jgi:hypothetical protein
LYKNIFWQKNGERVDVKKMKTFEKNASTQIDELNHLKLFNLKYKSQGIYECISKENGDIEVVKARIEVVVVSELLKNKTEYFLADNYESYHSLLFFIFSCLTCIVISMLIKSIINDFNNDKKTSQIKNDDEYRDISKYLIINLEKQKKLKKNDEKSNLVDVSFN